MEYTFGLVILVLFLIGYINSLYERYVVRLSYRFMKYYGINYLGRPHRSNDPSIVIFINYDFTIGKEIDKLLIEQTIHLRNSENIFIHTHETYRIFDFDRLNTVQDVIVLRSDGKYISLWELRNCIGLYTSKELRPEHNLEKMLRSGALKFIEYDKEKYKTNRDLK